MTARSSRITGPRQVAALGPLDPRLAAWRNDLADIALAGQITVPGYARPAMMEATRQTPMLAASNDAAVAVSELLPGERFALLDSGHGYAWGYHLVDHYVGYVALDALRAATDEPTHMVGPGDALIFARPDIKSAVIATLPAGSHLPAATGAPFLPAATGGPFLPAATGGYIHHRHLLVPGATPPADWVDIALAFTGAPYRWGGRSRAGIDCSGLVQMARLLSGHPCRRDSDMQAADARPIDPAEACRGDIAWWPGHIGILTAADTLLHANAHWMRCLAEPLAAVSDRAGAPPRFFRW